MDILSTADEADGGHTEATASHHLLCGIDQSLIVSETEVVIGAEVECVDLLAILVHGDGRALLAGDEALTLVSAGILDRLESLLEVLLILVVHRL